jgi:hypothetical protein
MTSSDNPIHNTITDVLGLGRKPATFAEKIDRLRGILTTGGVDYTKAHYVDVLRAEQGMTLVEGSRKYVTREEKVALVSRLEAEGRLPWSGQGVSEADILYYNDTTKRLLRSHTGGTKIFHVPTLGEDGIVYLNGRPRKALGIMSGDKLGKFSFESNITSIYLGASGQLSKLGKAIFDKQGERRLPLVVASPVFRGVLHSSEASWTSNSFLALHSAIAGTPLYGAIAGRDVASKALTILTRSGVISKELRNLKGSRNVAEAFAHIDQLREDFIGTLTGFLRDTGTLGTYPYIKPEKMGNTPHLVVGGEMLGRLYGTQFEERAATKGLFQLAHLSDTTGAQLRAAKSMGISPYAAFLVEGQARSEIYRKNRILKVAVIDSPSAAVSDAVFGDSGSFLTDVGRSTLKHRAHTGAIKINSPSDEVIAAVERLFGVNLADGRVQTSVGAKLRFTKAQVVRGGRRTDPKHKPNLTEVEQDIKLVLGAAGRRKYKGFIEQLAEGGSVLDKIELTDTSLSLDFLSLQARNTETVSMVVSGVRTTAAGIGPGHVLEGADFKGAQMVMAAEDFVKVHGPHAFLSNFVGFANEESNPAEIFRRVFGMDAESAPLNGERRYFIPRMKNVDTGYAQLRAAIENGTISPQLADKVLHGAEVGAVQMGKGVQGVARIMYLTGSIRTDQTMDINMFNPVRITPSKMRIMARGSGSLGYSHAMHNPLYSIFVNSDTTWRSGKVFVDRAGRVQLNKTSHSLRQMATVLKGGALPRNAAVVTMNGKNLMLGGVKLNPIPAAVHLFGTYSGGVSLDDLKGTILDRKLLKHKVLYLDMGAEKQVSILGRQTKLRYLPIPLDWLRAAKGAHGRIRIDKTHPSYEVINSLTKLQLALNVGLKNPENNMVGNTYEEFLKALPGREGLLARKSTILMRAGTRARLSPHYQEFFSAEDLLDPQKLFHGFMSNASFEDYMARKSGLMTNAQVDRIYKSIEKKGYFFAAVGVDPMQRTEHMMLRKIFVKGGKGGSVRNGIMNLVLNPLSYIFTERDLDMDPASFIPVTGRAAVNKSIGQTEEALEELYERQVKKMSPFVWFRNWELRNKGGAKGGSKFTDMIKNGFAKLEETISTYLGVKKSYGYSITRAAESVMDVLASSGLAGAKELGLFDKGISQELIEKAINPFRLDPERTSVAQQFLQNLYQGPVQKGHNKAAKSELETIGRYLSEIGEKYKYKNFDYDEVVNSATEDIERFLKSGKTNRAFIGMEYLAQKDPAIRASLEAMKADLARGAGVALGEASTASEHVTKGMARILAEYLVPGFIFQRTIGKVRDVNNVLQMTVSEDMDVARNILDPIAGNTTPAKKGLGIKEGAKEARKGAGKATNGFLRWADTNRGKLAIGLGAGAALGAGIVSLMNGPMPAPMPRDVNASQPMDTGPEVYERPPKIYGTNQVFNASRRRSPETFSPVGTYRFGSENQSTVTIRDRRAPNNPYLLEQQMRNAAKSDYNY